VPAPSVDYLWPRKIWQYKLPKLKSKKLWKQPRCPLLTNGLRKCDIYTQWNSTQSQKRMKFCHSQVNGWNWRTSSYAKLVRIKRPNVAYSPSCVDYRPKTNAAMLWDMGHIKGRPCTGGIGNSEFECG
jgi:hypothetical protein